MKRLLIYFLYDEHGIVDDYIFYALKSIKPFVSHIVVVANGKLTEDAQQRLQKEAQDVIVRSNIGFDVWAYKTGLDSIGWDTLVTFDEVILMNHTIMGPVYDLGEMFETMQAKDIDFWGITKCFREDNPAAAKMWHNPLGYVPEHIQSSFTVFRRSLVSSPDFQSMWNDMPMIESYYHSGGTYEQLLTKRFADLGFKWDCYTDYSSISPEDFGCCPLITAPLMVIKDLKSPFFKRRTFFTSKQEFPAGFPFVKEFFDFLENDIKFDMDMVMDNLIRCCNQRDLLESLLLFHVI